MDFGAHLPLMDFGGHPYSLAHLQHFTRTARDLGFAALSANDHMVFSVPWLDGPTALAAVIGESGEMTLMTTVALPVVRGPVALAKTLAAIDRLSNGRMVVGVGPGSSDKDYAAVGLDFEERWSRLDEAVHSLRALWQANSAPFDGSYYSTQGVELRPLPAQESGPPIWIGSWGSEAGLRRVARLGDGWLASAYNTTPDQFAAARARLGDLLSDNGKEPASFPNALATMWFHLTTDPIEAESVFRERIAATIHRPEDVLRDRIPVGPPEYFAEKLNDFRDAGVQRVLIWPVTDEARQLRRFVEDVVPLVGI